MKVCFISVGVSSFIAAYLARDVDKYIYIDVEDQHPDSLRFISDCEKVLDAPIEIIRNEMYRDVDSVCRAFGAINFPHGSPCTNVLKKRVRKKWEYEHRAEDLVYVWGMDASEFRRAERLCEGMKYAEHEFPLIDRNLSKDSAHGLCRTLGIRRPLMYDMGYNNNNCIGCVRGGKGYWNKIRKDFPNVFASRAKLERDIGHTIINGVYLDELPLDAGREPHEILGECDIFCALSVDGDG